MHADSIGDRNQETRDLVAGGWGLRAVGRRLSGRVSQGFDP